MSLRRTGPHLPARDCASSQCPARLVEAGQVDSDVANVGGRKDGGEGGRVTVQRGKAVTCATNTRR